jgi:hypothetical protein
VGVNQLLLHDSCTFHTIPVQYDSLKGTVNCLSLPNRTYFCGGFLITKRSLIRVLRSKSLRPAVSKRRHRTNHQSRHQCLQRRTARPRLLPQMSRRTPRHPDTLSDSLLLPSCALPAPGRLRCRECRRSTSGLLFSRRRTNENQRSRYRGQISVLFPGCYSR